MKKFMAKMRERFARKTETKPERVEDAMVTVTMTVEEWDTMTTAAVILKYCDEAKKFAAVDFPWDKFADASENVRWAVKYAKAAYFNDPDNPYDY